MQKWEYCVIAGVRLSGSGYIDGSYPKLLFFSNQGIERTVDLGVRGAKARPQGWEKANEGNYIAYIIATLGLEGWEMVNATTTSSPTSEHVIYFRRPID